jgi:hypothetical protein
MAARRERAAAGGARGQMQEFAAGQFHEISFRRSVDLQGKRLYHRRPESNIGFEATPEFLGCRVGTGFET